MIETWKQCYTGAHVTKAKTDPAYLVLGPFRGEGYIKEVRFVLASARTQAVGLGIVICGTGQGTAEELEVGSRVLDWSNSESTGVGRVWVAYTGFVIGAQVVIPLWRKVDTGSRFVVFGFKPAEETAASLLATVVVVGLAKMGANGSGVKDGLDR